jgi:site-specific recombinase XerD
MKINLYNGLKHSFGCQRIEQGFSKLDLKEVFGHRDMRSVDRYAKYHIGRVGEIMRGKICANLVQEKKEIYNYAKS